MWITTIERHLFLPVQKQMVKDEGASSYLLSEHQWKVFSLQERRENQKPSFPAHNRAI